VASYIGVQYIFIWLAFSSHTPISTNFLKRKFILIGVYQRRTVVIDSENKDPIQAYLYVVTKDYFHLLEKSDWDFNFFRENYLEQYVDMCKTFRKKLISG